MLVIPQLVPALFALNQFLYLLWRERYFSLVRSPLTGGWRNCAKPGFGMGRKCTLAFAGVLVWRAGLADVAGVVAAE